MPFRTLSLALFIPRRRARSIFPRVPSETEESDCDTRDYFYSRTEPPLLSFVRVNYPCFVRVNHRRRYPLSPPARPPSNLSTRDEGLDQSCFISRVERQFLCKLTFWRLRRRRIRGLSLMCTDLQTQFPSRYVYIV